MLRDDELAQRIEEDWQTAGLSQKREAMLRYSLKLTESPVDMVRADVDALRERAASLDAAWLRAALGA